MQFGRFKTLVRSLRFRLATWNTLVVLLMVIVTLVGVREGLRLTLLDETEQLLKDDAAEVVRAVEQLYPHMNDIIDEINRKVAGHADRGMFVRLLDASGKEMWSSSNMPQLPDLDSSESTNGLTIFGNNQIARRTVHQPGLPALTVLVGSSLEMVNRDVKKLTRLMVGAAAVILIIAPLGGYWLAGRATRKLGQLIATAARLRPDRLEERLPMRQTGDELDRLSATINRFLDLIAEYFDRNREFVANAAHELRSPLAAIQSSVEVALNSVRSSEEYEDLLYELSDQCGHLSVLVGQLLLLAETDNASVQLRKRPLRLDQMIDRSIDMFRGAAEERGIELVANLAGPVTLQGDADRLRQVINNLVDNSLKFTGPGGRVVVSAKQDPHQGQVVVSVSDTGIGIPAEDLPHVFQRFFRGDKSRHRDPAAHGSGLGLSICKSIVTAHGGTIGVASSPGQGTVFTVRLPHQTEMVQFAAGPVGG